MAAAERLPAAEHGCGRGPCSADGAAVAGAPTAAAGDSRLAMLLSCWPAALKGTVLCLTVSGESSGAGLIRRAPGSLFGQADQRRHYCCLWCALSVCFLITIAYTSSGLSTSQTHVVLLHCRQVTVSGRRTRRFKITDCPRCSNMFAGMACYHQMHHEMICRVLKH